GDYDFLFREYSNAGRWPSPDPAGLAAVDLTLPQSWNRYAYVLGEPLNIVDPLGLWGDGVPSSPHYPTPNGWMPALPCIGFSRDTSNCTPPPNQQADDDKKKREEAKKKKACDEAKAKLAALKEKARALQPQEHLKEYLKELGAGAAIGCVVGVVTV